MVNTIGKMDKLYINSASIDYIEYNNQIFPNNLHIHLRDFDAASSYHCPSPIVGSKILKWECILNCCADCPGMSSPDL